jgi:hypothetical protein
MLLLRVGLIVLGQHQVELRALLAQLAALAGLDQVVVVVARL